jgi:hypothetical protein
MSQVKSKNVSIESIPKRDPFGILDAAVSFTCLITTVIEIACLSIGEKLGAEPEDTGDTRMEEKDDDWVFV